MCFWLVHAFRRVAAEPSALPRPPVMPISKRHVLACHLCTHDLSCGRERPDTRLQLLIAQYECMDKHKATLTPQRYASYTRRHNGAGEAHTIAPSQRPCTCPARTQTMPKHFNSCPDRYYVALNSLASERGPNREPSFRPSNRDPKGRHAQ